MAGNSAAEERELQWNLLIHPRIALRQFPQRGYIAGLSHKGEAAAFLQFIDNGGKRRRSSIARTRRRDNLIGRVRHNDRSEEHTSELQSLMRISYAVFCLKKK